MPNCSADKGLKAIPIRGVSESPPGWSSICNLVCSVLSPEIVMHDAYRRTFRE